MGVLLYFCIGNYKYKLYDKRKKTANIGNIDEE